MRFLPLFFTSFTLLSNAQAANQIVSNLNDSGSGSLRQAVSDAVGGDTITFNPGLNGQTITLGGSEILIDKAITIDASDLPDGLTVDANEGSRVFQTTSRIDISDSQATQSTTFDIADSFPAANAIDGDLTNATRTSSSDVAPSLTVTLASDLIIGSLTIRNNDINTDRLRDITVELFDTSGSSTPFATFGPLNPNNELNSPRFIRLELSDATTVRKITISRPTNDGSNPEAVSYTHLTLPTIHLV